MIMSHCTKPAASSTQYIVLSMLQEKNYSRMWKSLKFVVARCEKLLVRYNLQCIVGLGIGSAVYP